MIPFKEYGKKHIVGTQYEWESHFENIIYLCDRNLNEFRPDTFLDVGCGNGERTVRTAGYFDIDLMKTYGLDYDDRLVAECGKTFNAQRIDLEADDIPHPDETFDLVICNQVLEHLKNYEKAVSEIIRVTKSRRYIILGIPNLAHLINRIYLMFGMQPMCIAVKSSHVRGFTHKAFIEILGTLEKVRLIDCAGSLMYPLPYFAAKYLSRLFVGLSGYTCYLLQKI